MSTVFTTSCLEMRTFLEFLESFSFIVNKTRLIIRNEIRISKYLLHLIERYLLILLTNLTSSC